MSFLLLLVMNYSTYSTFTVNHQPSQELLQLNFILCSSFMESTHFFIKLQLFVSTVTYTLWKAILNTF